MKHNHEMNYVKIYLENYLYKKYMLVIKALLNFKLGTKYNYRSGYYDNLS